MITYSFKEIFLFGYILFPITLLNIFPPTTTDSIKGILCSPHTAGVLRGILAASSPPIKEELLQHYQNNEWVIATQDEKILKVSKKFLSKIPYFAAQLHFKENQNNQKEKTTSLPFLSEDIKTIFNIIFYSHYNKQQFQYYISTQLPADISPEILSRLLLLADFLQEKSVQKICFKKFAHLMSTAKDEINQAMKNSLLGLPSHLTAAILESAYTEKIPLDLFTTLLTSDKGTLSSVIAVPYVTRLLNTPFKQIQSLLKTIKTNPTLINCIRKQAEHYPKIGIKYTTLIHSKESDLLVNPTIKYHLFAGRTKTEHNQAHYVYYDCSTDTSFRFNLPYNTKIYHLSPGKIMLKDQFTHYRKNETLEFPQNIFIVEEPGTIRRITLPPDWKPEESKKEGICQRFYDLSDNYCYSKTISYKKKLDGGNYPYLKTKFIRFNIYHLDNLEEPFFTCSHDPSKLRIENDYIFLKKGIWYIPPITEFAGFKIHKVSSLKKAGVTFPESSSIPHDHYIISTPGLWHIPSRQFYEFPCNFFLPEMKCTLSSIRTHYKFIAPHLIAFLRRDLITIFDITQQKVNQIFAPGFTEDYRKNIHYNQDRAKVIINNYYNPQHNNPCMGIYDMQTGELERKEGYYLPISKNNGKELSKELLSHVKHIPFFAKENKLYYTYQSSLDYYKAYPTTTARLLEELNSPNHPAQS